MKFRPVVFLLLVAAAFSCKKTIHYPAVAPADYFIPLKTGQYAIYRLDSLNFYYYGQLDTVTSYLVKDSVENSFIDGSGNTAWLITRYLSDTMGSSWYAGETYTATAFQQRLEVSFEEDLAHKVLRNIHKMRDRVPDSVHHSDGVCVAALFQHR